ncbi:putative glycolipid-binding domain-containing protein [Flavitalea sp.]|nr:putative glycolipid-binding domain-containing protein [Flavitalea sp.]
MSAIQTRVWKGIQFNTSEYLKLTSSATDQEVRSFITGEVEGIPVHIEYQLKIDSTWKVSFIFIKLISDTEQEIRLSSSTAGGWQADGVNMPGLDACTVPDISFTPFTNTLAIKRLDLQIGEQSEITVLYFDLPELMPKPMRQRYTRLDDRVYMYENVDSDFKAVLNIDEQAFVVDYPGLWKRVVLSEFSSGSL